MIYLQFFHLWLPKNLDLEICFCEIQKNYSSTAATAGIEGKFKSGCDFSIVNITYGAGNYIALRFTSNPEIDVLWTGFRLTDLLSGGAFQVITSGVTVNSTYASY